MPTPLDLLYGLALAPHYAWHRAVTGKYGPRAPEKWGRVPPTPADAGPVLWLHAVSLGEAVAAAGLGRAFRRRFPDWTIRLSTTTATGRAAAEKSFGADAVFYYPLDFSGAVRRAFERIWPSLILLMELEIWPQFLTEAARREVPVVVANARITERSERRFAKVPTLAGRWFGGVAHWYAQTEEYAARLRRLGAPTERITVAGSLKYDNVPVEIDPDGGASWRALLPGGAAGGPLIVAGSTHPGEEEALLAAWRELRGEFPDLRLYIAPRHPERWDAVHALMGKYGPVVRRRELGEPDGSRAVAVAAGGGGGAGVAAGAALVLGDSMGELTNWYAAADVVFVGGTLIPHGGQNLIEPCGLGRPTVCGPSLYNFADAAAALGEVDGYCPVADAAGLAGAFGGLLRDWSSARSMGARARAALLSRRGATERTLAGLAGSYGDAGYGDKRVPGTQ